MSDNETSRGPHGSRVLHRPLGERPLSDEYAARRTPPRPPTVEEAMARIDALERELGELRELVTRLARAVAAP